jgi:hypothetical protein
MALLIFTRLGPQQSHSLPTDTGGFSYQLGW